MNIESGKQLKVGDKIIHNGIWAYRVSNERVFEVLTTDSDQIRVRNDRGYVSLYKWHGCADFVTADFFASCSALKG